ncbi:dynein intermediate chain 3, ciliary-like [Zerene cesonia]|uniref:dynein intermediate chain 3, ciliary-like n=1 Tax=Zerene cesonia TaxID=33412 RepID=UPI0018E5106E|nr:dynein intermediate chain 3, ciliary-like [Zerene cesonia]
MKRYMKSNYEYTKLRKNFGRQPLFQEVPAHLLDSINPNVEQQKLYILRNPVHRTIQATMPQSEHDANTKQLVMHEQGINHSEGGWPRDVHLYNEDHLARHRRRVQHEDGYVNAILSLRPQIEHCIDQNNAIDMYQTYFANMYQQAPVEKYNLQIANIFRDPFERPASCIVWTNETQSRLVASYSYQVYGPEQDSKISTICYMWDINKQTEPLYEFCPENSCWRLTCSPVTPEVLLAGLNSGTINIFDIREGRSAVSKSSVYNSHRGPISGLLYGHSRTNSEFFSGSPDGQCLWWDIRNISKPIDQLYMSVRHGHHVSPSFSNAEGVSCLEFDKGLPTKFLSGTESGLVINANRMGRSHSEILASYWYAHTGPVRAVHRSPCTLRMFITCGDWSVRIWSEEVRTAPIIVTRPYRYQVTDVAWAPLRYSCYMAVCEGGVFYYWDILRKQREPVATLQVSKHGLTRVIAHPEGESIAVSDNHGSIYILHLSENMTTPGNQDKHLVHQIYDRETRREHILDNRVKEIRLKIRGEDITCLDREASIAEEDVLKTTEEEYFKIVNDEINKMDELFTKHNILE